MFKKLFIYILLTIFCMISIFVFSSKNTTESNGSSKYLIKYFVNTYEKVFDKDINEEKMITKLNYPIRKLAHYTLYFVLAIFIYQLLSSINSIQKKELIAIIICLVYAVTDEIHQLYVSGRTGQAKDVLIDILGSITSIMILSYIHKKKVIKNK